MFIESVMPSNHLIPVVPFSSCPQSFPASESFPVSWLFTSSYWSFSFSISPSNEYSGLISCRIHWFDLLVVQGVLKSLLQHHNLKASILQCSAFFVSNSHICTWLLEKPWLYPDPPLPASSSLPASIPYPSLPCSCLPGHPFCQHPYPPF